MDINLLIDDQDLAASDGRTFERCDRVTGAVATRAAAATTADAIQRLVAPLDMNAALPLDSLAYRFDIVLRGAARSCSRTSCRKVEP
jgi:protocatechuate 3,4-dioxygenase beta subunit